MNMTAQLEQGPILFTGTRDGTLSHPKPRGTVDCMMPPAGRAANFTVTLAKWRTAMLATRGAVEIRCLSGQLWITQLGDSSDIVLQAGQSHTVSKAMRDIVLSTVGSPCPAALEIIPANRSRGGWWRMLRGAQADFQLDIA